MPKGALYLDRRLVNQDEQHINPRRNVSRSRFTGTKTHKTTFNAGALIPFHWDEVYPGDHMTYRVTPLVRQSTLIFPMFDEQRVETFCFFVPLRHLWGSFKRFMGEQPGGPSDSIAFTIPQIVSATGGFAINSIYDHMGVPGAGQITAGETISISALPFRAYNQIWNEWFRDQDIQTAATVDTGDAADSSAIYSIRNRNKFHDYFTTCRPAPQKGAAPTVTIGGLAPVTGIGMNPTADPTNGDPSYNTVDGVSSGWAGWLSGDGNNMAFRADGTEVDSNPVIYADLTQATGMNINTLRSAIAIQEYLERDSRYGTRYPETVEAHFGVDVGDHRVQRPEYIGGGRSPLIVTPIAQTATGGGGLGALAGAGTATGQHQASYAVPEHGIIMWLINVRSELTYQQGLHRFLRRSTRFDLYSPEFANLGEQAVLREEIYCTGDNTQDTTVFGYQERYHELRTMYNTATGLFRSTSTGNIDEWHIGQQFTAAPTLSDTFIQDNPPMTRVLAAGASAADMQYLAAILIERDAVRPMPMHGTPSSFSRF